ncbi:CGNR zinc finger domain-containing protein [Amycolatopsis solani]|uniref:CGNR zinc finger domain-containing protein n=1 Tax=Amycolatopsis solani TaxID=3028615 RepID=UPI00296F9E74|nr:CGNR zinc finger domain-containing protein [Amycolatopsis sp. MEP2-6]
MPFEPYGERAVNTVVALVNSLTPGDDGLPDLDACAELLGEHGWIVDDLTSADLAFLRALRPRLRFAFEGGDEREVVAHLNRLLSECDVLPQLTDHDGGWHFHYARPGATLAQRVFVTSLMALLLVVRDRGSDRLRTCAADGCANVLFDTTKNHSRRFCDARTCANRVHTAAYRRRQRAKAGTPER